MTVCLAKVVKLDVCIRPLFANPVINALNMEERISKWNSTKAKPFGNNTDYQYTYIRM